MRTSNIERRTSNVERKRRARDFERGVSVSEFEKSRRSPNWHSRRQFLILDWQRALRGAEAGCFVFHSKSIIQHSTLPGGRGERKEIMNFERGASGSELGEIRRSPNWHSRRQFLILDWQRAVEMGWIMDFELWIGRELRAKRLLAAFSLIHIARGQGGEEDSAL